MFLITLLCLCIALISMLESAAIDSANLALQLPDDDDLLLSSSADNLDQIPIDTNTIQRYVQLAASGSARSAQQHTDEAARSLKKVFLSNRSITCNDGSQAGFYLRKSHSSKKWIIFLEGGWYCYDHLSCQNRWLRQRHYMTSAHWPETRNVGGILSPNEDENPYYFNVNHVFIPYCTSDSWSGSRVATNDHGQFSFLGASVVQQVVRDLVQLGLENSTDLLLAGSSAGGTGVMLNLDPVQELLHDMLGLRHVAVRGVTDSGWFLDRTPFTAASSDSAATTAISAGKPTVDAIRKGMQLWQGKVPRRCRMQHQHEPWRCYFGYLLYPTLRAPLFVFQWLFDEAQMDADNVGAPVTKAQWDYIHKMGDALRHSLRNVSAVFAPSCISHAVLTKRDWLHVTIDDVSVADAIHCWEEQLQQAHFDKIAAANNNNHMVRRSKKTVNRTTDLTSAQQGGQERRHRQHNKQRRNNGKNNNRNNNNNLKNKRGHGGNKNRLRGRQGNDDNNNDSDGQAAAGNRKIRRNRRKQHLHPNHHRNRFAKQQQQQHRRQQKQLQNSVQNRLPSESDAQTQVTNNNSPVVPVQRAQRSVLRAQQQQKHHRRRASLHGKCQQQLRRLERCSWPQCNHSCPRLHNPVTGDELDLLELLKSFGLDMESVARALGIDMPTLTSMDHGELLKLLTQQAN